MSVSCLHYIESKFHYYSTSFHGEQPDAKQSGMMKMWNMFSSKLSGATESEICVHVFILSIPYSLVFKRISLYPHRKVKGRL